MHSWASVGGCGEGDPGNEVVMPETLLAPGLPDQGGDGVCYDNNLSCFHKSGTEDSLSLTHAHWEPG